VVKVMYQRPCKKSCIIIRTEEVCTLALLINKKIVLSPVTLKKKKKALVTLPHAALVSNVLGR
jgi:hypothetical protein